MNLLQNIQMPYSSLEWHQLQEIECQLHKSQPIAI